MLPPLARITNPADSVPSKHLHSSLNKIKHPVNVVRWTPEGRRLLTGSSSGEFTLWNGMSFNFETIMSVRIATCPTANGSKLLTKHRLTSPLFAQQYGLIAMTGLSRQIRMVSSNIGNRTSTTSKQYKVTKLQSEILLSLPQTPSLSPLQMMPL